MHTANRKFWRYCQRKYARYFKGQVNVLEVGSQNVNGSVREYFKKAKSRNKTYIGVDWRAGPGVDVICLAHNMVFDKKFDVVISCSMLEHDPNWGKSLVSMIQYLKEDGILLLSWGAALNPPHCLETATDNQFHGLPAEYVIDIVQQNGIYIHEFRYEGLLSFTTKRDYVSPGGMGEVCLVGFKDPKHAIGDKIVDTLLPGDKIRR
jgi:SAM-dependent methyltransferase